MKLRHRLGDLKGHVNNVTYNRYAESGRVAWVQNYARHIDPEHKSTWENLATPKGELGMILRKITTEFKL
jgi:acyl-CoA thioesterase FadM